MSEPKSAEVDGLGEEHRLFRDHVRRFCQQQIAPLVEEAEITETFPAGLFPKLGAAGLLCPTFPERYGAAGADTVTFCILAEELGRVCSGIAGSVIAHSSIGTSAILEYGTEAQRERWLPSAVRGESVFAFALTEPNAGSDVKSVEARAARTGDRYVIEGAKSFITNGGICTHALVAARTAPGDAGLSLFVVPSSAPGFVVDGKVKKLGNRSSDCVFLHLDGCQVSEDARIGAEGQGFQMLMRSLGGGRMVVAARAVGLGEAALDAALSYARERRQFGRRIADFQAIQLKLARMATRLRAARLMVYDAARTKDRGEDVTLPAAMAKLFATETCNLVADDALQIHGAYGYSREFPVERYYRDARLTTIVEGTSEIQHLIIARALI
ncbi:MAG: acyl-CoA dehydrogenase family protein [Deltaproteobacteria bacterium]|nr:acyl-CoA dehydrogenase family protein [Deltaproteobacteria bacterium]